MGVLENLEPHEWLYLVLLISLIVWQLLRWPAAKKSADNDENVTLPFEEEAENREKARGTHRLSDLQGILEQLAAKETWGMVVDLQFTAGLERSQMIVNRNHVELYCESLEVSDRDRFRRAARIVGLEARSAYEEGQYCVDVNGSWPEIASKVTRMIADFHGVSEDDRVDVRIFK